MFRNLLVMVVTTPFRRIYPFGQWRTRSKETLQLKYHKIVEFERVKVKWGNRVAFYCFTFADERSGIKLTADELTVGFSLHRRKKPLDLIRSVKVVGAELSRSHDRPAGAVPPPTSPSAKSPPPTSPAAKLERLYRTAAAYGTRFVDLLSRPRSIELISCACKYGQQTIVIDHLQLHDHSFDLRCSMTRNGKKNSLQTSGLLQPAYRRENSDSLHFSIDSSLTHLSIADKNIIIPGKDKVSGLSIKGILDKSGLRLLPESQITFNSLQFFISLRHDSGVGLPVGLTIKSAYCTINDFLASFPHFYYRDIYTASYAGGFKFDVELEVRLDPPSNFDIRVGSDQDVAILHPGKLQLECLKAPFTHRVYDGGKYVREILLDPANGDYTPLRDCSNYLKYALLVSEDPDFFNHKGINFRSMGLALVVNAAALRIARGGSSVTMQLVRNLFLRQERSLYKKIEEVFLSSLLEGIIRIDKNRMYEIYLNIIEFGPDVYGIAEGARFYFGKDPASLSLMESLVFTYIVPRPKYFVEALRNGSLILADNLEREIEFIAGEMYKRKVITRADINTIPDKIEFRNGLGKIFFKDKFAQLNPVLGETFRAALALWLQRNKGLPVPAISHSHHAGSDAGDLDPHARYPSLAFKIQFRKDTGIIKQPGTLYRKFAECIAEVDSEKKLHWGGNDTLKPDPSHFELADWRSCQ